MANLIPSLLQASQNQRARSEGGLQKIQGFAQNAENRKKLQTRAAMGKAFVTRGNFTKEGIMQFAQENKIDIPEMMEVVKLVSQFNKFKKENMPKTFRADIITETGETRSKMFNEETGQEVFDIGKTGFSPTEKQGQELLKKQTFAQDPALIEAGENKIRFRAKTTAKELADNPPRSIADIMNSEMKLRKEFQDQAGVKSYEKLRPQVDRIDALMKGVSTGKTKNLVAVDQALIMIFNKMLDENSVVRESEYARTAQNLSLLNRVKGTLGKQVSGGASLANDDRFAIYDAIQQFDGIAKNDYNEKGGYYEGLASSYGLESSRVVQSGFGGGSADKSLPQAGQPVQPPAVTPDIQQQTQGKRRSQDPKVNDFLTDFFGSK